MLLLYMLTAYPMLPNVRHAPPGPAPSTLSEANRSAVAGVRGAHITAAHHTDAVVSCSDPAASGSCHDARGGRLAVLLDMCHKMRQVLLKLSRLFAAGARVEDSRLLWNIVRQHPKSDSD